MRRWYHILATLVFAPSVLFAQGTGFSGTGTATGGTNLGGTGTAQGAGLAGQANTTLLGNTVNLNFLPVFGTSATIANTNPDPFAAYRPTGSGTGSTVAGGAGSTIGNAFAGGGMNTGTVAPAGGANLGGNNLNRAGTNLGTFGGGLTGGLGGMNRNMMGGGFLGGGMGMGMNNQQGMINMGYRVNYEGQSVNKITPNASLSPELQQRLTTAPGMQGASNLQVLVSGDIAILRGRVSSDYARELAAAMIRLEPGIYRVENQLEIVPAKP